MAQCKKDCGGIAIDRYKIVDVDGKEKRVFDKTCCNRCGGPVVMDFKEDNPTIHLSIDSFNALFRRVK